MWGAMLLVLGACLAGSPGSGPGAPAASAMPLNTGKVFLSKEEALKLAFPHGEIVRETVFLTPAQVAQVDALAGFKTKLKIAHTYRALEHGKLLGYAWFDVSRVRSKKQLVMFVVGADQRIKRFELLAFGEPSDYIPRPNWYAQLLGKRLDGKLKLKKGIKAVSGATLTARATVGAARRVLALQATLFPLPKAPNTPQESAPATPQR